MKTLLTSIFTLFLSLFLNNPSNAQSFKIDIGVDNYTNDTLIIGYYLGSRQLVKDTLVDSSQKKFVWSGDEPLHQGVYLVLTKPDNNFIQLFIDEAYPKFGIKFDATQMENVTFKNSKENQEFNDYVTFLSKQRPKADEYRAKLETAEQKEKAELEKELDRIDQMVDLRQNQLLREIPNSMAAKTISLPCWQNQ